MFLWQTASKTTSIVSDECVEIIKWVCVFALCEVSYDQVAEQLTENIWLILFPP